MALDLGSVVNKLIELSPDEKATVKKGSNGLYLVQIEKIGDKRRKNQSIELNIVPSSVEYGIIHVPQKHVNFFPGYREQFVLETDVKPFVMHLSAAADGTQVGDAIGGYIGHPRAKDVEARFLDKAPDANRVQLGTFKRFYDVHTDLVGGSVEINRKSNELYALKVNPRN